MATDWQEIEASTTTTLKLFRMRAYTDYTIEVLYSPSAGTTEGDQVVAATRHISTGSTGVDALDGQ